MFERATLRTSQSPFNTTRSFQIAASVAKGTGQFEIDRNYTDGLSSAYYCISHDLLIAKPGAYGLDISSLRLLMDYLNFRK